MKQYLRSAWDLMCGKPEEWYRTLPPSLDSNECYPTAVAEEKEMLKLKINQGKDQQWYVRLLGANGRIMLSSEGYTRKSHAERACSRLQACVIEYAE